jgi:uncharacterized membrane protein (UPF0136 family)
MLSHPDRTKVTMSVLLIAIVGSTALAGTQIQQAFAAVNGLPTVNPIPDQMVDELQQLTFNVTASDPDGQQLVFSLQNPPYGATIDSITGAFTWTPTEEQGSGVYHINVIVSDGMVISSGTVMIIVNDVGGGGHGGGGGRAGSSIILEPDLGPSVIGSTDLSASPSSIPLDGTTSLLQESDPVNEGKLMSLTVQEPDGDVCAADGQDVVIPSSGLTNEYPTDFSLVTDAGDGECDTGDIGTYTAQSEVSTKSGTVQDSTQFEIESPFVLPESPIGLIALLGSSLAALGAFTVIRGRASRL